MAVVEMLEALLSGGGWPVAGDCDLGPPEPCQPVRLRRDVCYVVLAVLLNEKDEVLMMQEAKPGCRGTWYLPAGRMEPGETIVQAMRREVQEETGLQCEPLTLLRVEEQGPAWIRFVFLARPTGGTLKSLQQADAESLQALWWDRKAPVLTLRSRDILPLMDLALHYHTTPQHPPTLPVELPCPSLCQRFLFVYVNESHSVWVLLGTVGDPHLPTTVSSTSPPALGESLLLPMGQFLGKHLACHKEACRLKGLLGLQHLGKEPGQNDGVCFNLLVTVGGCVFPKGPPRLRGETFTWWKVEHAALKSKILQRVKTPFSCLPLDQPTSPPAPQGQPGTAASCPTPSYLL